MKRLILFISLCIFHLGYGQLLVENEIHTYTIADFNSYERTIQIEGLNQSHNDEFISFPVNELSELISVESQEFKKGKWKNSKINNAVRVSNLDWSSFYSGIKRYYYKVPPNTHFRIIFKSREEHTILLSKIYKRGYFDAQNTTYNFHLPENFTLSTSNGGNYQMDRSFHQNDFDSLNEIAYLIHNSDFEPKMYFSNWFEKRIDPQLELGEEFIPEELLLISKKESRAELAKACFKYVQREVKYIDIENGINAIIPRNCEKILVKNIGDCKDMATLLVSLYRHFGFESYFGISRTNSKKGVFDFPSVGLANHAICVLKLNEEWIYLDATEDACLFGDPSLQILGTEVFLVGHSEKYFQEILNQPNFELKNNFDFTFIGDQIHLIVETSGKLNRFFYGTSLKVNDSEESLVKALNYCTKLDWSLDSSFISDSNSKLKFSASILNSTITKAGDRNYIDLSFLISPELAIALFQANDYPLYNFQLATTIVFEGNIVNPIDGLQGEALNASVDSNKLTVNQNYQACESEEVFLKSELVKKWKHFIKKPIITEYVE